MQNVKQNMLGVSENSSGEIMNWSRLIIMIHSIWSKIGEPNKNFFKVLIGFGVQIFMKKIVLRTVSWLLTYFIEEIGNVK